MCDGAGTDVGIEEAGIQHEYLDEGGKAKLPRLQDQAAFVQAIKQSRLRPVQSKGSLLTLLRLDRIQVVETPAAVG